MRARAARISNNSRSFPTMDFRESPEFVLTPAIRLLRRTASSWLGRAMVKLPRKHSKPASLWIDEMPVDVHLTIADLVCEGNFTDDGLNLAHTSKGQRRTVQYLFLSSAKEGVRYLGINNGWADLLVGHIRDLVIRCSKYCFGQGTRNELPLVRLLQGTELKAPRSQVPVPSLSLLDAPMH